MTLYLQRILCFLVCFMWYMEWFSS